MDPVFSLVCLLVGSALTLAVLGLLLRRGMRQLAVAGAYREVATRLGLEADTRGVSLQGHMGHRRLWIGEVMVGHGPERKMVCWGVVDFDRPLGLGLMLRRRGLSDRVFRRSRAPETRISDADLAKRLEARGDDPGRVHALITADVQQALRGLISRWPDLVVTDRSVRVHLAHPLSSADQLHALVDAMMHVAANIEEARRDVEPPGALEASADAWATLAEAKGLDLEPWLPALSGTLAGRHVVLAPDRSGAGYTAELRLRFRPHPELGFRLRPQVAPDGYWSVGQDIQVGDPTFDDAFVIKGYDPAAIRALLGPEARRHLLALAARGPIAIDDRTLILQGLPTDPTELGAVLDEAAAAADELGW